MTSIRIIRWASFGESNIQFITLFLAICSIIAEVNLWLALPKVSIVVSLLLIVVTIASIGLPAAGLGWRLIQIISHDVAARPRDIWFVGLTYISFILAFAILYAVLMGLIGFDLFHFSHSPSRLHIVDCLYLSGITITTVGFGDIVPAYAPVKLLIVIESLAGLWLSASVLGLIVGSLLSSRQQAREVLWFRDFQAAYFNALNKFSEAIATMQTLQPEEWSELETSLLENIANIVRLQYHPLPSAKVSANWMQLYAAEDAPAEAITLAQEFVPPTMRNAGAMRGLWGILVLREWGEKPNNMPGNGELALPVYDPENPELTTYQLPGAPLAVASADGYDVVSDVRQLDLESLEISVQTKLKEYFTEHWSELKSFASVRVGFPGGGTLGAINIQSSETDLCGTSTIEQRIIVDMIRPFARHLAQIYVNRAKLEGELNEQN